MNLFLKKLITYPKIMHKLNLGLKKILIKTMENVLYKEYIIYNMVYYTSYINRYKHACWKYKKKINVTKGN